MSGSVRTMVPVAPTSQTRRSLTRIAVGTAVTILATAAIGAPPAAAANHTVTVTCSPPPAGQVVGQMVFSPSTLTAATGDTIDFVNKIGGNLKQLSSTGATNLAPATVSNNGTGSITVSAGGSVMLDGMPACLAKSFSWTIGDTSGVEPATDRSTPAPLIQQFGKPSSGTCLAAAQPSLNWSGVASGGWGESWAEWMNGGKGGAVCTRTLVFNMNTEKWMLG